MTNVEMVLATYDKSDGEILYTFKLTIPRWIGFKLKAAQFIDKACRFLEIPSLVKSLVLENQVTGTEDEISDWMRNRSRLHPILAFYSPAMYLKMCEHFNFTTDMFSRISGNNRAGVSVKVIQEAARLYGKRMNDVFKVLGDGQLHEDFLPKAV